jgi:hypothetical protein
MNYKIVEIEDPETNDVTHRVQDSENTTLSILEDELGEDSISEAYQIDANYIEARYTDYFSNEFSALFTPDGGLIKKGICELTYMPETDEFIILTNANGDEVCYEYTSDHEKDLYGIINSSGDYVLKPQWSLIEYNDFYGCYICNNNAYFLNGEYIGNLVVDLDEAILLKNGESFYLLYEDKSLSDSYEWLSKKFIELPSGTIAIVAKKKGKYGVIDSKNNIILDFKFDEINLESFIHPFNNGESIYDELIFTTKLGGLIILKRIVSDGSVSDYLKCVGDYFKIITINTDEAPIAVFFHDYEFSVYKILQNHEFVSSGNIEIEGNKSIAIFSLNGKYGFVEKSNSNTPLLPFIYDSIEILYFNNIPSFGKLGFLASISNENRIEILVYDYESNSYNIILTGTEKENILNEFKALISNSLSTYNKYT